MLTEKEKQTISYYDQNAELWSSHRKKATEPSFWNHEYDVLDLLRN